MNDRYIGLRVKVTKASITILVLAMLLAGSCFAFYLNYQREQALLAQTRAQEQNQIALANLQGRIAQLDHDQAVQVSDYMQAAASKQWNYTPLGNDHVNGSHAYLYAGIGYEVGLWIYHASDVNDTQRPVLLSEGFVASCIFLCQTPYEIPASLVTFFPSSALSEDGSGNVWATGILYYLDPTATFTDGGGNFFQCKIYGVAGTGAGSTCTSADTADVIGFSESTTAISHTDTYSSGPCSSTNEITDSNGLKDAAYTPAAGAAGSTITTTVSTGTLTISGTGYSNVQVACLYTEVNTGSNVIVVAEANFGPDTFASGDTLTGTWSNSISGV